MGVVVKPRELSGTARDIPEGTLDPAEELLPAGAAVGALISCTTISVGVHPVVAAMAVSKTLVKMMLCFFKILSLQMEYALERIPIT